jgi:hypothetical protein
MYYKVFTSNGDYEIGYLYNITDLEQVRSYLLWEADNQYNDDTLDDDRYEAKVAKIKAMDFSNLTSQDELKQEFVDGFVDKLYVTSSKKEFATNLLDESQRDLVGNAPWGE